jgi:hypothetical protein
LHNRKLYWALGMSLNGTGYTGNGSILLGYITIYYR